MNEEIRKLIAGTNRVTEQLRNDMAGRPVGIRGGLLFAKFLGAWAVAFGALVLLAGIILTVAVIAIVGPILALLWGVLWILGQFGIVP